MRTKFKGIKTLAEYRRGELCKDILRLIAAGAIAGASVVAPNTIQIIEVFAPSSRTERMRILKALKYLEAKQHVRIEDSGEERIVHLTATGKHKLDESFIWDLVIAVPNRWDKKWRLVMFDFPSNHSVARHAFRAKLEDLGFRLYQRSVFIFPHESYEEVMAVAHWYKVQQHVRYIVATEINDSRHFAQKFGLLD